MRLEEPGETSGKNKHKEQARNMMLGRHRESFNLLSTYANIHSLVYTNIHMAVVRQNAVTPAVMHTFISRS